MGGTSHRLPARHYIQSVTPSNEGTYFCHASVGNETQSYSVSITIRGSFCSPFIFAILYLYLSIDYLVDYPLKKHEQESKTFILKKYLKPSYEPNGEI